MTIPRAVYIAGPDVFLPDSAAVLAAKQKLVAQYGFRAIVPSDDHLKQRAGALPPAAAPADPKGLSREIYAANVAAMREADFAICHLTPFRGCSADVGTAFELGLMTGLGKPVFGYTNLVADYIERIGIKGATNPGGAEPAGPPQWRDALDCSIENFANADNLMLDGALAAAGSDMVRREVPMAALYSDLAGFTACLELARAHFAGAAGAVVSHAPPSAFAFDH